MKQLYLTLTFLLPLFGGTVLAQTGLTIFGDCYVSETASIGFFGEQLTLKADVKGEGRLVMAGKDSQTIDAHDKTISRLVISNPTVVEVRGKLTVRKSIVIERGNLEVLPQARLHLASQATLTLAPGSHLIQLPDGIRPAENTAPTTQNRNPDFYLPNTDVKRTVLALITPGPLVSQPTACNYHAPSLSNTATPPWA